MRIFHFSDIHYSDRGAEYIREMVSGIIEDLAGKVSEDDYFVITGDLVFAGSNQDSFTAFKRDVLDRFINELGVSAEKIIACPGNHDLNTHKVSGLAYGHKFTVEEFDDYYKENDAYFSDLLSFYEELSRANKKIGSNYIYEFSDVTFLCLNTATLSVGGNSRLAKDKERLIFTTAGLLDWAVSNKDKKRIILMHHPINWLDQDWANFLESFIRAHVDMVFHGHEHKRDLVVRCDDFGGAVVVSAPALFSSDADRLGYGYVDLSKGINRFIYRQWSPANRRFLVGVDFSGNDDGAIDVSVKSVGEEDFIRRLYERHLNDAMTIFDGGEVKWIDRLLYNSPETKISDRKLKDDGVDVSAVWLSNESVCIFAPPQYGLSCLGHYICLTALKDGKFGVLVCLKKIRPYHKEIRKFIDGQLSVLNKRFDDIDFIVFDSWADHSVNEEKAFSEIAKIVGKKLIFLCACSMRLEDVGLDNRKGFGSLGIQKGLYLHALSRDGVRQGVKTYGGGRFTKGVGEDGLLTRVIDDFNVLNLPRTPLNCFTLLRVLEQNYDESLINRGDMVSKVLSIAFFSVELPSYSRTPDVKDCEFVIGFFCANIIRTKIDSFLFEDFVTFCDRICKEQLFDIDSRVMFDILYKNKIIVRFGRQYCFRFFYWVNYFAAKNMQHNDDFKRFIFSSGNYVSYPEIIEFYTGTDRKREDALDVISSDLSVAIQDVSKRVGDGGFFPYPSLKWVMSANETEKVAEHLEREVVASNLPTKIKDEYSDRTYDARRPYDQTVDQVMHLTSMRSLINLVHAAGKALRNSDFAAVDKRKALLMSFVSGIFQINRVLVLLAPMLARSGRAHFDDAGFSLSDDFVGDFPEKLYSIISEIPWNLVNWYSFDILSEKLGPMIRAVVESDEDDFLMMFLAAIVVRNRPAGWEGIVRPYIERQSKESFALWFVFRQLVSERKYGFCDAKVAEELGFLAKMCILKHNGIKSLGKKNIEAVDDKFIS